MGAKQVLDIVLTAVLIVLCGVGIYGIVVLVRTLRAAHLLLGDLHQRVPTVLDDADVTLNALTLELMRVDGILGEVEQVSDTVGSAARAAEEAVQVPLQKAAAYAERLRHALSRGRK